MANLRAELQRKATGAFLQYALLRIESALVIAGTISGRRLRARAFAGGPDGRWLVLGVLGWVAIVVSSLTDPRTSAKVLWQMLGEQSQICVRSRTRAAGPRSRRWSTTCSPWRPISTDS